MTHPSFRVLVLAAALIATGAAPVAAQNPPFRAPRSLVPVVSPRWDAGASAGLLSITTPESGGSWTGWQEAAEVRADVGRYWTTHLKTELGVGTSTAWTNYESERIPVPGSVAPSYAFTRIRRRVYTLAPAVTWQFRENTFMHPYVSGGAKLGIVQDHRDRESGMSVVGNTSGAVARREERSTTLRARPFVAAGFKSYLSRAVYVRTEGRLAFAQDGVRHVSLLAGIGVDF